MSHIVSSQTLWYLTRGSGIVTFILLSACVVLGLLTARRTESPLWPRFAVAELHQRVALTAVVFLALHVATAVSDPFAPIGWLSALAPFTSTYRPIWLGLGALSVDLLLAILVTSLLRRHLSERLWRVVHWLAYLSWPVAIFHTLGTGSDVRDGWFLAVIAICVLAVLVAFGLRLTERVARSGPRLAGGVGAAMLAASGAAFVVLGPLQANWAQRAGTPASDIASGSGAAHGASSPGAATLPAPPDAASVSGTLATAQRADGGEQITIAVTVSGAERATLRVQLVGTPADGGGVSVTSSSATYGPPAAPTLYRGSATEVAGTHLVLSLANSAGSPLRLDLQLRLAGRTVTGSLHVLGGSASGTSTAPGARERGDSVRGREDNGGE